MLRNSINAYLSSFMSLAQDRKAARVSLIREALAAESLVGLIREWFWLQEIDHASALKLKLWFQLNYAELAEIFGLTTREVSQLLRNQRVSQLPNYRPEGGAAGEFSCFMLEQHLSPWIDSEISDLKTIESICLHTTTCSLCRQRLEEFRSLQTTILNSRISEPPITEEEWDAAVHSFRRESRRGILKILGSVSVILLLSLLIAWAIFSKPDKMPNVYELIR